MACACLPMAWQAASCGHVGPEVQEQHPSIWHQLLWRAGARYPGEAQGHRVPEGNQRCPLPGWNCWMSLADGTMSLLAPGSVPLPLKSTLTALP